MSLTFTIISLHTHYKISVKARQFITQNTVLGRHVSTHLSHLQALQETDPSFVNVYGAFWDPELLQHSGSKNAVTKLGSVSWRA